MENIIDLSKLPIEDVGAIVNIVALNNAGKIIKADADYITTESLLATIEPFVTDEELDDALLEYYTSNEVDDFISDVREVAEQAKTIAENAVDEGELNIKLAEQDQKINEAKTIAEQAKTEASNGVTEGEVDQKISDAIANIPTGTTVIVDAELSTTSTNPVQNKAIATKINSIENDLIEFDNYKQTINENERNIQYLGDEYNEYERLFEYTKTSMIDGEYESRVPRFWVGTLDRYEYERKDKNTLYFIKEG